MSETLCSGASRDINWGLVRRVTLLALGINVVLAALKLCAGYFDHSEAVVADGVESVCDLAVGMAALLGAVAGRKPFDKQHPYGHGKIESLTAGAIGLVILGTGVLILLSAVRGSLAPPSERPGVFALGVVVLTIVVKESLALYTFRAARKTKSQLLNVLAVDHRKDAVTSIATIIGVGGAMIGFARLDPIAAGVSGLLILKSGWECLSKVCDDLLDRALPEDVLEPFAKLAESVEGVEHVHEIKGRRYGQMYWIDLKLEMDPEMSVRVSHDVGLRVKRLLFESDEHVGEVMIHVNPHDDGAHEDLIRI